MIDDDWWLILMEMLKLMMIDDMIDIDGNVKVDDDCWWLKC